MEKEKELEQTANNNANQEEEAKQVKTETPESKNASQPSEATGETKTTETTETTETPTASETPEPLVNQETTVDTETTMPPLSLLERAEEACIAITSDNMDDNERQALTELIRSLVKDIEKGKMGKRTIKKLRHALHYDEDLATAAREGEIKGRNTKIEEFLAERKRTAHMHCPVGTHGNIKPTPPSDIIGGLAAADRKNIWERGNERRIIY
ncbi:MAG: hypothetical protein II674_11075 [Prevotella sp.]|nr:hypothetical protein [Prevotella sp.]